MFLGTIITHVVRVSVSFVTYFSMAFSLPSLVLLSKRSQGERLNASEAGAKKKKNPLTFPVASKEYKDTVKTQPLK